MPRRNTKLEAEGAEFLVLGELLINRVAAYKAYTNMPGYDVVAIDPKRKSVARISVKSRRNTGATGFLIKNFDCDFVVIAKLNRGPGRALVRAPEFFVLPSSTVKRAAQNATGWGRIEFGKIAHFKKYAGRWELVRTFLAKQS